jgi:hypothetical protein
LLTCIDSVAEFAEKPLYRVTCGDIGTNAEQVEDYLKTILLLGKTWQCGKQLMVVLKAVIETVSCTSRRSGCVP